MTLPLAHVTVAGALGFAVPLLLGIVWVKLQSRRDQADPSRPRNMRTRRATIVEDWTLEIDRVHGLRVVAIRPVAGAGDPRDPAIPSPWAPTARPDPAPPSSSNGVRPDPTSAALRQAGQ
jgi:hypothetical protein